jgi:GAF domain-containing protein
MAGQPAKLTDERKTRRARRRPAAMTGRQAERLAVLHRASQAISRSLDEEQVYAATYHAVGQLVPADAFVIALLSDDQHHIDGVYLVDRGERRPTQRAGAGEGLAGYVLQAGRPILFHSAAEWPSSVSHYGGADSVQSVLAVPMQVGDRVFGMLAAEAYRLDAYSSDDIDLLATVANQAASAIHNARRFRLAHEQLTTLTLLHEVTRATVSAATVDELVSQAVEVLAQRLGYEIIGVALVDPGGKTWSLHPSYRGEDVQGAQGQPMTLGLVGETLRTGQARRVDEVALHPAYDPAVPGVRSELVVPLKVADRVIGAINTESRQPAAYRETDEQVLSVVAGLLAPIIENVQLRGRAEQHARDLDRLVAVQQASSSLNVNRVLTGVVEQLAQALDVTSAYVVELRDGYATTVAEYYSPAASPQERISDLYVHYRAELFGRALEAMQTGEPVHMRLDDETTTLAEREHLRLFGAQAALVVPLLRQSGPLGYVKLWESRRDRRFSETEVQLAKTLAGHAATALENAKLYEAAQRRADQMRLVNEVGRDIGGILDEAALLEQVCRRLESTFGYYHAKLGLLIGDEVVFPERLDVRRGRLLSEARLRLGGPGLIAQAVQQARSCLALDVTQDLNFLPNPQLPGTRSEAAVPVSAHGRTLGVLDVQSDRVGDFRPDDIATLEAIAGLVAAALDNARLVREARQRTAEVSGLMATAMALGSSPIRLEERLRLIARQAIALVDADSATIYRLTPDGQELRPLIVIDEHYAEQVMADVVTVGEGVIGQVVRNGVGEMVNRVDLDPRALTIPGTPMEPESLLAIPLAVGERVIGLMAVYRESLLEFSQHHFDLISSFAAQAAVAIENAELYETVRERANSLQATYEELAEMDRLKDELVQNISHELRTPLTFLKSYVDLLLSEELGPLQAKQAHSLRIVQAKTEALVRLVNDIITLQAVTPQTLKLVPTDLAQLARTAADGVAAVAREAGVEVQTNLPATSVMVQGDALRLSQVFDNLLGNAIKFTSRGGRIELSARSSERHVRVEICDTGVGIAPENVDRIFDRFYQVDGTPTRRRGGIGLGLAICKLIVEVHGGTIGVQSQLGTGSCFFFSLPLDTTVNPAAS